MSRACAGLEESLVEGIEDDWDFSAAEQSAPEANDYLHINSTMLAEKVAILTDKSYEVRRRTIQLDSLLAINSNAIIENERLETWLPKYLSYLEEILTECRCLVENFVDKLLPTLRWYSWELNDTIPSMTDVRQSYSQLICICLHLKESTEKIPQAAIPWRFQSVCYNRTASVFYELTNCHSSLLANPVAVSKQPEYILRTTKLAPIQVRSLCGNRPFVSGGMPTAKVIIINEEQAKKVHQVGFPNGIQKGETDGSGATYETSGTLTGDTADISSTGTWEFQKLSIKTVRRKKLTNNESVLDEKYCFLVYTTTPLENGRIWWCCSRPFFVTVNNSQNPKVLLSVFIEESFRLRSRKPFDVPESVPCSELVAALEKYFMRRTYCQRGFTSTNNAFLRAKLLKHAAAEPAQDPLVNLKRLSEKEGDFNFTFFTWFSGIIEIVTSHLKSYWEDNLIIGFIDRLTTERLLGRDSEDGAFIVRFSESKLSSITISYIFEMRQKFICESLAPFTSAKLVSLSLPEILQGRIHQRTLKKVYFFQVGDGCEKLEWKSKSEAFPPFLTGEPEEKSGSTNIRGYVTWNVVKSIVANEEDAQNTANVPSDQFPVPRDERLLTVTSYSHHMLTTSNQNQFPCMDEPYQCPPLKLLDQFPIQSDLGQSVGCSHSIDSHHHRHYDAHNIAN